MNFNSKFELKTFKIEAVHKKFLIKAFWVKERDFERKEIFSGHFY